MNKLTISTNLLKSPFLISHFILCYIADELIYTKPWGKALRIKRDEFCLCWYLILTIKEYCTWFYHRHRFARIFISWYVPSQPALYSDTPLSIIGKVLVIHHGRTSRINADRIGKNCQFEQCYYWRRQTRGL